MNWALARNTSGTNGGRLIKDVNGVLQVAYPLIVISLLIGAGLFTDGLLTGIGTLSAACLIVLQYGPVDLGMAGTLFVALLGLSWVLTSLAIWPLRITAVVVLVITVGYLLHTYR